MTLKNSFLASMKENNKRRIWLWLISAFGFVVLWPTFIALTISRTLSSLEHYMEWYGAAAGEQLIHAALLSNMKTMLGVSYPVMYAVVAGIAIVSAIQGYSFLYSKKKIDFYMGMPVKRKKRFFVIWLNGILAFYLPYLLGTGIGLLFALANGGMSPAVLSAALSAMGLFLLFYLGIYHLAILAVMMTGNVIITCFGVIVFLLYEVVVRYLIQGYMEMFFKHFSYYGYKTEPVFSPIAILWNFAEKATKGQGNPWLTALFLLLFALVIGVIAYLCYLKRPAEAAGHAMAFKLPQPFIKILITIPATLLAGGMIIGTTDSYDPRRNSTEGFGFVVFAMLVTLIVCNCLIQVIYEFDIRGILHKKRHILISGVAVIIIFSVFRFDLFGYDSRIPAAEKVESAAFTPTTSGNYFENIYFNENMENVDAMSYVAENMYLSDVGAVCKLAKKSMEKINNQEEDLYAKLYNGEEVEGTWYTAQVIFRMSSGKSVCRRIFVNVDDTENQELLDRIQGTDEFRVGYYQAAGEVMDEAMTDTKKEITAVYGNGVYRHKLQKEELQKLLTLYKKDVRTTNFTNIRENEASGYIFLSVKTKGRNYSYTSEAGIAIYPFFTECINYLKELGYYNEQYIELEDVEKIQVMKYNYDLQREWEREQQKEQAALIGEDTEIVSTETAALMGYGMMDKGELEFRTYATYESKEDIQKMADFIYPQETNNSGWSREKGAENDYTVIVYFKPESKVSQDYGNMAYYTFKEGEVPDFVEKDTKYQNTLEGN